MVYAIFENDGVCIFALPSNHGNFYLEFQCTGLYRQLSLLSHIFTQCLPLFSHICHLYLEVEDCALQLDERDSIHWLELLRSFNAVQILEVIAPALRYSLEIHIARVLGELTSAAGEFPERATEVLPIMHTLVLSGLHPVGYLMTPLLKPFVDARQLSGQPVEVG